MNTKIWKFENGFNEDFCKWIKNNFEFKDATHPADSTHQLAADYILERFKF